MPFTGSHPAAVLPFFRVLVPSALVIGSMVPDLGYYVPLPYDAAFAHSTTGIFTVDLVSGLLSFAVWQMLVAPVVVALMPSAVRERLEPLVPWQSYLDLKKATLVVVSVWVGAVTHVLWDEFTHPGRFGTHHIAWLAATHGALPGYQWAQYGSGVLGGLVLLGVAAHWFTSTKPVGPASPPLENSAAVWATVLVATAVGAVIGWLTNAEGARRGLFLVATWGGGFGLAALLLCCLVFRRDVVFRREVG